MFIVLIHWRIKPDQKSIDDFLNYWNVEVPIQNDNNLIGEFLSKPYDIVGAKYPIDLLLPEEAAPCVSYVNVGLWKDEPSFFSQIGRYIPNNGSKKDFEQYPRRRIPLDPEHWRRGKSQLPDLNNLLSNVTPS